ncbi:hypothetical protein [Methylobacterium fujisawaense]|uniref:hypothetical protein n=1 Tax=Methylobacterium fujisawaense TaxID=107400 RepID=UPI00313AF1F2
MNVGMQGTISASKQYESNQKTALVPDEPDSGSINGGIDRAQRIALQLSVLADHADGLSDRLTGNGQIAGDNANASVPPQMSGHVDALHLALSRQEMTVQRLRAALEEIERRIG